MNLTSPSQVKAWCIANEFHPNKVLGQNFLIDRNALLAIVDGGLEKVRQSIESTDRPIHVLEIGPGLGVMTEELLRRGCRVTAIEKDPALSARLAESLGNPSALTVIAGDALDPTTRRIDEAAPFDCLISNLPYQAGTRILLEIVCERRIPSLTVLVQTEVAERIAAGPGGKTRSLSGVWTQLDYDVRLLRKVSPSCFWPRPEVGSTVVRLDRHDRNIALSIEERDVFHRLTKHAFEHRRKQLGSVFRNLIQSSARAEELSNEDWVQLAKGLTANEDT